MTFSTPESFRTIPFLGDTSGVRCLRVRLKMRHQHASHKQLLHKEYRAKHSWYFSKVELQCMKRWTALLMALLFLLSLSVLVLDGKGIIAWTSEHGDSRHNPARAAKTRVLVTGAAGFIGFHATHGLRNRGHTVIGVDSFEGFYDVSLKHKRAARLGVPLFNVSVCDSADMSQLIRENNISHVLHLAAYAGVRYSLKHPLAYVQSNIKCFTVLLELLRLEFPHVPLVFASSSSVYGTNKKVPFSESDPVGNPVSPYAATKRADELLAHVYHIAYGLRVIGLRFFTVYGPWGRPDMAYYSFSEAMMRNESIQIYNGGHVSRDFTYVDDIVAGVVQAVERAESFDYDIFNLGNSQVHSVMDLVRALEHEYGFEARKEYVPQAKGDVPTTFADLSKSRRLLGYNPRVSLQDGIRAFARWFLNQTRQREE